MNRNQMIRSFAVAVVMISAFAASSTFAQTATGNLAISATVVPLCTVGAGSLNFGNYDPNSGTALDGAGTFTLTCTKGTAYSIALDNGLNYSGGRRMLGGGEYLTYELYTSAARTTVWDATNVVTGTAANRAPATINVYGRIPINQDVVAATFNDTVQITVTY